MSESVWVRFSERTPPVSAMVYIRRVKDKRGLFETEKATPVEFLEALHEGVSVRVIGQAVPIKCVASKWEWSSIENGEEEVKGKRPGRKSKA